MTNSQTLSRLFYLFLFVIAIAEVQAQTLSPARIQSLATKYTLQSFDELYDLLQLPNDAAYPQDIEKNVLWCEKALSQRGFTSQRLSTPTVPLLVSLRGHSEAAKTVLFYFHIDGQPVDPAKWDQPDPYKPVLKEKNSDGTWSTIPKKELKNYKDDWRIYARSSADDKGPFVMFLAALDALEEAGVKPDYNVKVILDFEEEKGSPHLPDAVRENASKLEADRLLIFDGPGHMSNRPTLTFGARGIVDVHMTTYGAVVPQHSGHFGNYAPNPAMRLAQLLASMKDDQGRVVIPGFYNGIDIDSETEKILRAVPDDPEYFRQLQQLGSTDSVGDYYQESIQYPSLNIHGLQSGWVREQARTIVPADATAEIDIRLVPESNPDALISALKDHIRSKGYYITTEEPTKEVRLSHPRILKLYHRVSYRAFRTDFDTPIGRWLRESVDRTFGQEPVMIRTLGGSVPIAPFIQTIGVPAVIVPVVNPDNNQHSPNENMRLGNYRTGVQTIMGILTQPYGE